MGLPAVFLPTAAPPLVVDTNVEGFQAMANSIVAALYDRTVAAFNATDPPDPARLGVPLPDGTQDRATFVPPDDLLTFCQSSTVYANRCMEILLPYAIAKEREYWDKVIQKPADGVTREARTPLEDVLRVMHARDGVRIDPVTGVGTWLCREHVPEMVSERKHLLTWRETLGHLLRARHWYPYHDGRCRSPLHGGDKNVQPKHAINGHVPEDFAGTTTWTNAAEALRYQHTGHWNYGAEIYEHDGKPPPPEAAFTFYDGNEEMTLYEAAAYVAAGQQAVVLRDVLTAFGAEAVAMMNDGHHARGVMHTIWTMFVPLANECPEVSIRKAEWVLERYGPVDAWRIEGEQIRLEAINPDAIRYTLDPLMADWHYGGAQGGGGIRMRVTWGEHRPYRLSTEGDNYIRYRIKEGFTLINVFRGSQLEQLSRPPPALAGLPSNMLHMSQINWKMGAWFLSDRNTPVNVCRLYSVHSAYEENAYFNQYIGDWDTSNLRIADGAFYNAASFNQPLRTWNVVNLERTDLMFGHAASFDQGPDTLRSWVQWAENADKKAFYSMFGGCTALARRVQTWLNSLPSSSTTRVDAAEAMEKLRVYGPPAWWAVTSNEQF